jgi:tetratricopeptide (TPR) repeat protein
MAAAAMAASKPAEDPARLALIRNIRAVNPRDATSAYNASLDALDFGLEDIGLALLEPAIGFAPRDHRLHQVAGLLHRQIEDLAPAIAAFTQAARLAPQDGQIAHSLARAHLEAGLPSVALFQAARRLAPQDADVVLGLIAALQADEGPEAAAAELALTLQTHRRWLTGHEALARLRWQSGDKDGFTASLDALLADEPRNMEAWRSLIITLTQGDLYERTLEALERGRAAAGPNVLFDANEAVSRSELGQFGQADALFARLQGIDDPTLRVRQTRHLLRAGRVAEAIAVAEPMLATAQAHLFWPYMALAWRLTGDPRAQWLEGDPRLVGVYDLADRLPPLDALAARLRLLHISKHQPLEQSVRLGTQTDGALFSRLESEIRTLRQVIADTVKQHVAGLPPIDPDHPTLAKKREGRIRFAGSWSVRLTSGGHHANHIHPAGWFSSAFYVALPDPAQRGDATAGWLTLGEPQDRLGLDLAPTRLIEPKPGRLVLFPSTMWHGTRPFDAGERLTVAFDVAPPS